jgi:hypothetical protein
VKWVVGEIFVGEMYPNLFLDIAQANIHAAPNNVSFWTRRKCFKISSIKIVAMHICRKRIQNHRDPEIRLNRHRLEIKNTRKILGLTFDNRLTWKTHLDEVRANASKKMNLLTCLAGMN